MIVALAGLSKSGKSSLASELAVALDWPVIGFGNYVRHVARERAKPLDIPTLQELGQSMVEKDPRRFVEAVLEFGGLASVDNAILDGLRHVEILDALESVVAPESVIVVHVNTALDELRRRHQRDGSDLDRMLAAPSEQQIQSRLSARATLVVDGAKPIAAAVQQVALLVANAQKVP